MQFHLDNHFLPQFYLESWCKDRKVYIHRNFVINKNVPNWERKSIKYIGFYTDLYTDYFEGNRSDEVERWLDKEFENPAKTCLNKIKSGLKLDDDDNYNLTRFMFAQLVRTPKFVKNNLSKWVKIVNDTFGNIDLIQEVELDRKSDFDGDKHIPIKTELIKDIDDNKSLMKIETQVGRGFWLFGMKQYLINTIKILPKYKWSIIQAPNNYYWPTSDNPVTILNYYSEDEYSFEGGLGFTGSEILFPISPKQLLYTQVNKKHPSYSNPDIAKARNYSKIICENSDEYIISLKPSDEYANYCIRVVDKNMKSGSTLEWILEQNRYDMNFMKKGR